MKKILVIILLLIKFTTFSQKSIVLSDKEYYSLQEESRRLLNSNRDSSFILADRIEKSNKYLHKAFALGIKSYLFQLKGDSIKSKKNYSRAISFLEKEQNSNEKLKIQSYLLNFSGLSEWKRGNILKALDLFEKGKKISKKTDDKLQIIKFISNIALINSEIGKYSEAIKVTNQALLMIEKNIGMFDEKQYYANKSTNYLQIGWYYQERYQLDKKKKVFLDSSTIFYKKAIFYSDYSLINKINAHKSVGINYLLNNDLDNSLNLFKKTLILINDSNDLQTEVANIYFNIGCVYYLKKKHIKSLVYLKKIDSLYSIDKKFVSTIDYIRSMNYQARIYQELGSFKQADKFSKIASDEYEKKLEYLNDKKIDVINKLSNETLQKDMLIIQKEYRNNFFFDLSIKIVITLIFLILAFFLLKSVNDKKRIEAKVNSLIEENTENKKTKIFQGNSLLKRSIQMSIDDEDEILKKIKQIDERKDYLKQEFNQQYLAKKLKTNTTYISYIFNKIYNKTFSNYYNELRLNHVVNEILNNKIYREYSTQAIAESAGFKNADSFTISFKKKTGLTPYQFINEIKKREIL